MDLSGWGGLCHVPSFTIEGHELRDAYHEELDSLSYKLVEMTRLVRSAMARATTALLDADLRLAEEVISSDEHVNKIHLEIEETVFDLMARQQPVASDLRQVITTLRTSGDLERMGDLAVHIAKTARRRHPESAVPPELQATILEMGQIAERMIAKAGSVIASQDVEMGLELDTDDDAMDRLHSKLFRTLLAPSWKHGVEPAVDITLAGRYFERFADHAVHVAENVVYLVTGQRPEEIIENK
ncbi:MAG: Phosphate-specific transport system accessory protein PhoU [Actinomycetia bacterium]|nr:Phosphate-specific transport system accessory protein PhoU [Actinomycetes bacterium]